MMVSEASAFINYLDEKLRQELLRRSDLSFIIYNPYIHAEIRP